MDDESVGRSDNVIAGSGFVTVETSYTIPTPEMLWKKLVGVLEAKALPNWNSDPDWTETMTTVFREIGQSFGFETRDRFVGGEYMGLDQV